jgi:hypothetical protein
MGSSARFLPPPTERERFPDAAKALAHLRDAHNAAKLNQL